MPPIDWGRHLVGHPVPRRVDTKGSTRYHEPDMAHPPPGATPDNTKEWERETWVARMASLSNFRHHVPGDIPTPDERQPAPSTYMTLMYNLHYTLSTTHYHAPTNHWVVHGTDSLLPADYTPPTHNPGPDTYARGDDPGDPHIWGTWERKSLDTLLSISSSCQGLGRAMYCLAKWTQRTWGIPTDQWVWVVTLRPQQGEAPSNRRGHTPPRPTTLQLCPYMVAARLMTLLWPGPDTPTQNYPHLREGHARHPAMLLPDPRLPPANTPARPGADMATPWVTHMPAQPRQRRHTSTSTHRSPGETRAHARCPNLHPHSHYLQDQASYARPQSPGPSAVSHSPLLRLRLHNLHHHDHLIHDHHHVLIQHSTPQAAGDTSQTGPLTRPHREQPHRRQGPPP